MRALAAAIKWIMLVSGALTCTMFYAAVAPDASFRSTFGDELEGDAARLVVRNWGVLVGLVGMSLIWGALRPAVRGMALVLGGVSKTVFIGLLLARGAQYLTTQARIAIVVDALAVLLFLTYALSVRPSTRTAAPV